jgi:hypothetical protein
MPRDQEVRATPRNSALGALADFLAKSYSPERTQQMQGVAKFLDMPSISETLDRLSYDPSGRSLFTGAGGLGGTTRFRPEVLDAAIAVAPGAGALGKLAAQGTMAAGRAGARLADRAVPRIMDRGGMGAEMLQGMSRNTVSPMDVYHGSPHKFDRFDASKIGTGEGNQAYGHGLYTAEAPAVAKGYQLAEATYKTLHGGLTNKQEFVADMLSQGRPEMSILDLYAQKYGGSFDDAMKDLIDVKEIYKKSGNFYKVDLPDEQIAKMLDWDKPLSEQPDVIKALKGTDYEVGVSQKEAERIADMRLRQEADEWAEMTGGDPVDYSNNVDWEKYVDGVRKESGSIDSSITGKDLHRMVMRDEGYRPDLFDSENYQVGTSETLRGMGIPGIKYLDATSRGAGTGTRNFVTFPGEEKNLTILERNGQPIIAPAVPEEHKMLQGFYRGYAGENLDTPELFVSPQKRIADYYADKRARQTGAEPHAEMVLMDPFAGVTYGHSTMGTGAKEPMFTNAKKIKLEDIEGRTQLYQAGGAVKFLQNMLVNSGEKAITAAQRAAAGRAAAELIKSQDQVKASEALGQLMEKGFKQTTTTQADRTRVGSGNIGGAPFPALSQADPAYAGKVWGVMDEGTASRLKNLTTPDTAWTTMLGSATQLKTNPIVFDKLKRQFVDSMKRGNLSDELAGKINHNLSLTFGEGADIRDPGIWKLADTFEKRAALADAMMGQGIPPGKGGVALGGEKSGRGVIFRPTDTLIRETEPYLLPVEFGGNVPTYAAGPRLFSLEQESMYRPDLHPGFPTLIKGEDLNYNMMPTPTEVYLPDWHARFKANNPERKAPGYYDLALGVKDEGLPSQALNDAYIQHLLREGYAEGGAVHMDEGGAAFGVFPQMQPRRAQQDRTASANAPLSALRGYVAGTAGLPGDIEGLARAGISQLPPQVLAAFPALRAFGIGSRADPTPQLPTTEFYNEYLPGAQLNATPTGKAFTTAGNLFGGAGSTTLARYGIKSAKATVKAIAEAAPGPASGSRAAQLGVIKLPGGNWLKGSVEDSLSDLKGRTLSPEDMAQAREAIKLSPNPQYTVDAARRLNEYDANLSLNNFIDKKIAPYIRNEMATPDDPLRAMAEKYAVDKPVKLAEVQARIDAFAAKMEQTARDRGVPVGDLTSMRQQMIGLEKEKALVEAREGLHVSPEQLNFRPEMHGRYLQPGQTAVAQSLPAKAWEGASDNFINVSTASKHNLPLSFSEINRGIKSTVDDNPWIAKVPPETPVYYPEGFGMSRNVNDLGFDHLVDELRNATNPESGLPKNLLIDPADLGKLTMPQAVDRVADINAWRATQKIEANQLLANNAATQLVKEYPGQGMKWVELNQPKAVLEEGHAPGPVSGYPDMHGIIDQRTGQSVSLGATPEEALGLYKRQERYKALEDALKYEGDTMQHCVGGYCPDVAEGRSRIYSLRDDKGQPRVTIEVEPHDGWFIKADRMPDPSGKNKSFHQLIDNERSELARQKGGFGYIGESYEDTANRLANQYQLEAKPNISQIKGFKNKKPADEFLPFVQDFVKSGDWSDVRDLGNTGLKTLDEAFPDYDMAKYFNRVNPDNRYISQKDIDNFTKEWNRPEPPPEGMAHGGLVSHHFDPIKIQQIIARMDDDFDPERIQQIVAQRESAYA